MSDVKLQGLMPDNLRVRSSRILLESLAVQTDIGFHDFEVGSPQRLLVSIEIWLEDDRRRPATTPSAHGIMIFCARRSKKLPDHAVSICKKRWPTPFLSVSPLSVECVRCAFERRSRTSM